MGSPVRIILVDDHTILREGLRAILNAQFDLEVVGEASTIEDALQLARHLQPDVVISDISFPQGNGIQAIGHLRRECPQARILMLTVHDTVECKQAAMAAGADGYVVKDARCEVLLNAIRHSVGVQQRPAHSLHVPMTMHERQVLMGIALGHTSKRIAVNLGRSVKTIDKHRSKLMRRLGLRNVAAVTQYALANGFMGVHQPL